MEAIEGNQIQNIDDLNSLFNILAELENIFSLELRDLIKNLITELDRTPATNTMLLGLLGKLVR